MPKNPADINPPKSKNPDITFIGIDPGPGRADSDNEGEVELGEGREVQYYIQITHHIFLHR